jgi:protein transport protein SEC13
MPTADAPVLLASGGADTAVKLWQCANGQWSLLQTFRDHGDWVRDVAFSTDAGSRHVVLASCSQDKTVVLRRSLRDDLKDWETSSPVTFNDTVWRLSWSPCGSMLLVTTADAQAYVLKQGASFGDEWIRSPISADEPAAAS